MGQTFALEDEDHTLGNSLRFFLNKNPNVTFCGYSIMHPSEKMVNLRIQTSGEITPAQALREACENLKFVCGRIKSTFITEMEQVRPNPSLMEE